MKINTCKITLTAILSALTIVLTAFVSIKLPNGSYIHMGDAAIFTAAVLTGPFGGIFTGGVASAIADVLAGAPQWVPATLIAKGLMGFSVGLISTRTSKNYFNVRNFAAMIVGALVMVICYYIAYAFMLYDGNFLKPLSGIWLDFLQAGVGIILSSLILAAVHNRNF